MQIKTTVRYHLTLVRMTIIKTCTNHKHWRGCRGKGTLLHSCWECKLIQQLWRIVWKFLKKLKYFFREFPKEFSYVFNILSQCNLLSKIVRCYIQRVKRKRDPCQPRILYPEKLSFRNEGEIKISQRNKTERCYHH